MAVQFCAVITKLTILITKDRVTRIILEDFKDSVFDVRQLAFGLTGQMPLYYEAVFITYPFVLLFLKQSM